PVIHSSRKGYAATTSRNTPTTASGTSTASVTVRPIHSNSHPGGTSRRAPSRNPVYQSGWLPAPALPGSEGPYTQIGPTVTAEATTNSAAVTTANTPPARVAAVASGTPTMLSSRRPLPANWGGWMRYARHARTTTISNRAAGTISTWMP